MFAGLSVRFSDFHLKNEFWHALAPYTRLTAVAAACATAAVGTATIAVPVEGDAAGNAVPAPGPARFTGQAYAFTGQAS